MGIGASVALDVVNDTQTIAAIPKDITVTGGKSLTVSATTHHTVVTEDKAGSEGGTLALSPSVSIAIVNDVTSATIGSGPSMTVTGDATISAKETVGGDLDSDAEAGGNNVAIGVAVAVNVIESNATADLERSLTAGSLTVSASTEGSSEGKAEASSKGEEDSSTTKSADSQTNDQVQNNPATKNKTDSGSMTTATPQASDSTSTASSDSKSESGDDSGGVNIAAAVVVNWARHTTLAQIGNGTNTPTISTGDGAVSVTSENTISANAKAIGLSTNLQSDVAIGAAVGLNVESVSNTASIGAGVTVTGGAVSVEATTPDGKENDFIVWAFAVAGGKADASVAASAGIQVLGFNTTASIGKGAQITAGDTLDVKATNPMGLEDLGVSGALSTSGTAVGGAFAVNILTVNTLAFVDSDGTGLGACANGTTCLSVTNGTSVTSKTTLVPLSPELPEPFKDKVTLPAFSSIAVGGSAGGGDAAVTGSFIVEVFSFDTEAYIAADARVNQTAPYSTGGSTQTLDISAEDDTTLVNVPGALALTEGSAGIAASVDVEVITKKVKAYIGQGAMVNAGGDVSIGAISTENLFVLAIAGAASEDVAVTGSIIVVDLNGGSQSTTAFIDNDAVLHGGGKVDISASDNAPLSLSAGNVAVTSGAAGVGASAVILLRNGNVDAAVHSNATVDANGSTGLSVSAQQTENLTLIAVGGAGGDDAGVAGSVVVDDMHNSTHAHLDSGVTVGDSSASAALAVSASDTTTDLSIAGALAIGGTAGVGAGIDVEAITKDTEASVGEGSSVNVHGDATVDATSSESITSISVGAGFGRRRRSQRQRRRVGAQRSQPSRSSAARAPTRRQHTIARARTARA